MGNKIVIHYCGAFDHATHATQSDNSYSQVLMYFDDHYPTNFRKIPYP